MFRDSAGNYYGTEQPELLVFITDGEPNLVRTASGGWADASETAEPTRPWRWLGGPRATAPG